jgi:hypothetical protein
VCDHDEAALLTEAIKGVPKEQQQPLAEGASPLHAPLAAGWPELALQVLRTFGDTQRRNKGSRVISHGGLSMLHADVREEEPVCAIAVPRGLGVPSDPLAAGGSGDSRAAGRHRVLRIRCVRVCLFVRAGIGPWRCVAVGANPMFNSPSFALTMTDPQKEKKLDRSFKLLASSHSLLEPAWLAGPSVQA